MLENLELEKFDVYAGTVIRTTSHGAVIKLHNIDVEAFCFCSARPGDQVLVSISKIDLEGRVRCRIDSFNYFAA